ncbi:TRAP transporter substrate-binding protein [Phreatobacter stygius]|uniref:TRAP transporter substrate-binding protein n=1 Tax=Phreatobacter stygius TaxID=1940610 RepID=A0A4D7B8J3_9HYPH|nr:TRAP transporter substrate-binding protein [Phreatobacter stygius]QCI67255.1 TRAP transporter substrate-binding protein [Phreatobacter stygius]
MLTRRIVSVGVAAAALTSPFVVRGQSPIRMRLAHATAEIHPGHVAAVKFKEALEKLVPGRVNVQIFGNRQLGDDKQNLESAIAGTTQLCLASGVLFPLVTGRSALNAFQLPFLLKDYAHFGKMAVSDIGQKILDDLAPAGLVGLEVTDIGQRHFLSATRQVKKVADFTGLKTRIVPVPLHKSIWEAAGTSPVGLPYGEVYGALETKVIDAVEINVSSILGENLWEVGKNLTLTGHYPWHAVIAANKTFFDRQPAEIQAAMREAGRSSTQAALDYARDQDLSARDLLKAKGVQITELEDLTAMREKMRPLIAQYAAQSPLIAEFVEKAQAAA